MTSPNHANHQDRLDFVQQLLKEQFNIEAPATVSPIHYDPECPFKYNNFVYRVGLPHPTASGHASRNRTRRPGCSPVPDGIRELIVRLTNSDAYGVSRTTRVENEVAMISLAAAALSSFKPSIVPSVYAWGSAAAEASQGWIIQEFMPGEPVDEAFMSMDFTTQKMILAQQAEILKALQNYKLPSTITGFGGVTFDDNGKIVSAAMTSVGAGPWPSYEASFRGRLEVALQSADANPYIRGWHANGIRNRMDAFVERGIPSLFASLNTEHETSIIHGDFTTNNLLFDASTKRITALIDYDFACILHPSSEFLCSFDGSGGRFQGWPGEEDGEQAALRKAKLEGFPYPLPASTEDGVNWEIAKAWEDELENLSVKRPSIIAGIDNVADVDTVLRTILPWRLSSSDILRMQSEEVIMGCKDENEKQLIQLLGRLGF
ncbi:kinase-like domain-containing protein [Nemania sp. FL0916]|nr:kinase-like domain-containing protein [Nemania sp. FL0916]